MLHRAVKQIHVHLPKMQRISHSHLGTVGWIGVGMLSYYVIQWIVVCIVTDAPSLCIYSVGLVDIYANPLSQRCEEMICDCLLSIVSSQSHAAQVQAGSKTGRGSDEGTPVSLLSIYNLQELSVNHRCSTHMASRARGPLFSAHLYWGMTDITALWHQLHTFLCSV